MLRARCRGGGRKGAGAKRRGKAERPRGAGVGRVAAHAGRHGDGREGQGPLRRVSRAGPGCGACSVVKRPERCIFLPRIPRNAPHTFPAGAPPRATRRRPPRRQGRAGRGVEGNRRGWGGYTSPTRPLHKYASRSAGGLAPRPAAAVPIVRRALRAPGRRPGSRGAEVGSGSLTFGGGGCRLRPNPALRPACKSASESGFAVPGSVMRLGVRDGVSI